MFKKTFITGVVILIIVSFVTISRAAELLSVKLPAPNLNSGKSLMQSLQLRKSSRDFSTKKLSLEVLSSMLWAANGINRAESGKRTAPSAVNWQEIDIYIAMADGLYLYNAKEHILKQVIKKDIRELTGKQAFVKEAPVNLIYVADYSRMGKANADERNFYSAADTGFIAQNVYLYCASEGLATVIRGSIDKDVLAKAMRLSDNQKIIMSQTVGYPE
ncbi:Oxygen-insensitive NADPH nitroreductase [Smithella sp. ME-1]|uniref:Oxygen-insensitive nadph nitroreductase n=1 Tax=hydrocarbon metagenome TaxID=938273 RepID=A0A0W8FRH9_9ZZZZ|nr:Oxygen-insensitive NADPH nitroreductase [Smithella sp. ME-1]